MWRVAILLMFVVGGCVRGGLDSAPRYDGGQYLHDSLMTADLVVEGTPRASPDGSRPAVMQVTRILRGAERLASEPVRLELAAPY